MANKKANTIKRFVENLSKEVTDAAYNGGGGGGSSEVKTIIADRQGLRLKNWDRIRDFYIKCANNYDEKNYTKDTKINEIENGLAYIPLTCMYDSEESAHNVIQVNPGNSDISIFRADRVTLQSLNTISSIEVSKDLTIEEAFNLLPLDLYTETSSTATLEVIMPYVDGEVYDKQ